jgi:hypothetical protein
MGTTIALTAATQQPTQNPSILSIFAETAVSLGLLYIVCERQIGRSLADE